MTKKRPVGSQHTAKTVLAAVCYTLLVIIAALLCVASGVFIVLIYYNAASAYLIGESDAQLLWSYSLPVFAGSAIFLLYNTAYLRSFINQILGVKKVSMLKGREQES